MTGAEVVVASCQAAGATMMYGYPITPATDVFTGWIKNKQKYLQTEDEIAAGFAVCGAVMGGQMAFTATSGPGHVLMQDGLSMAEGMRLPFVLVAAQRGGPSSGTVVYSQQEVDLACYGGNGEGMRFVYSPASLEELYQLTYKAFFDAWKYRFPAVILTDGYTLKTKNIVDLPNNTAKVVSYPLVSEDKVVHWQNIYTLEEELNAKIVEAKKDFEVAAETVAECETINTEKAEIIIIAHGIVALSVQSTLEGLNKRGKKIGMFRPITLRPFAKEILNKVVSQKSVKKIVVIESSSGQLARVVHDELSPEIGVCFEYLQRPALGIEPDEIIEFFK